MCVYFKSYNTLRGCDNLKAAHSWFREFSPINYDLPLIYTTVDDFPQHATCFKFNSHLQGNR